MSIGKQVWVICDGGCPATTSEHDANTAKEACEIAWRLGWVSAGGLDLCPKCKVVHTEAVSHAS